MVSAYSMTGRKNEMYIVSNDILSSRNLSFLIMLGVVGWCDGAG